MILEYNFMMLYVHPTLITKEILIAVEYRQKEVKGSQITRHECRK